MKDIPLTIEFPFGNIVGETPHIPPFSWEKFDFPFWRKWMSLNFHLPLIFAVLYITLVFSGRSWMTNRSPYKLKSILVVWNVIFAVFSLVAFLRTFPDLLYALRKPDGFYHSVCSSEGQSYAYAFWSWVGTLSKVAELGDTAFLILRKNDLIFLHWYHHAATMLYTWYIFEAQEPCHRWLMTMNYFIHTFMYSYFAARAAGIKLPRKLAMIITTLQITQMVIGVYVNWYSWVMLSSGKPCDRSEKNLKLAFFMYASYLLLFINFFYNSYFKKGSKKKSTKAE